MPGSKRGKAESASLSTSVSSSIRSLVSQLEKMTVDLKDARKGCLPDRLFKDLLRIEPSIRTDDYENLKNAVSKSRQKIIDRLDEDSFRCLIYVLLCLSEKAGQEDGLYLLLDGSQGLNESRISTFQMQSPRPRSKSNSIRSKLSEILYSLFVDTQRDIRSRRLAGKLLLDLVLESEASISNSLTRSELALYVPLGSQTHHRISSVLSGERDYFLRLFAGSLTRAFHASHNAHKVWASESLGLKEVFLKSLHISQKNWIKLFDFYASTLSPSTWDSPRTRSASDRYLRLVFTRHLVQKVKIHEKEYIGKEILTASDTDTLIFILPENHTSGKYTEGFQYIEVPLQYISRAHSAQLDNIDDGKFSLAVHLNSDNCILVNGKQTNGTSIIVISNVDLTLFSKALKEDSDKCSRRIKGNHPTTKRTSSVLVTLDTGEEILRKSTQRFSHSRPDTQDSRTDSQLQPRSIGVLHQKPTSNNKVDGESLTQTTSIVEDSFPTLDQINYQTIDVPEQGMEQQVIVSSVEPMPTEMDNQYGGSLQNAIDQSGMEQQLTKPILKEATVQGSSSLRQTRRSPRNPSIVDSEGRSLAGTTASVSDKNHFSKSWKRTKSSNNNKRKSSLPNTQESLLFPRLRRTNRKVYTTHSKPVDWDEDLRPSDEGDKGEGQTQQESDFTSIPSPSPGESSVFDKTASTARKKRKSQNPPTENSRSTKKKKANGGRKTKRGAKLPLSYGKEKIEVAENSNGDIDEAANEKASGRGTTNTSTEPLDDAVEDNVILSEHSLSSDSDLANVDSRGIRNQEGNSGELNERTHRWESDDHEHEDEAHYMLTSGDTEQETIKEGREQKVGEKLAAALDQGDISQETHATHSQHGFESDSIYTPNSNHGAQVLDEDSNCEKVGSQSNEGKKDDVQIVKPKRLLCTKKRSPSFNSLDVPHSKRIQATSALSFVQPEDRSLLSDASPLSSVPSWVSSICRENNKHPSKSRNKRSLTPVPAGLRVDSPDGTVNSQETTVVCSSAYREASASARHSIKRTIVDKNGSPRMNCRSYFVCPSIARSVSGRDQEFEEEEGDSGYDGDSDYYGTEESPTNGTPRSSFRSTMAGNRGELWHEPLRYSISLSDSSDKENMSPVGCANTKRLSFADRLRLSSGRPTKNKQFISPEESLPSIQPRKIADNIKVNSKDKAPSPESASGPSVEDQAPVQSELGRGVRMSVEGNDGKSKWEDSLRSISQNATKIILSTSESLLRHVENEKSTVSQVLDSYREGCHRVLDQLFEAQEQRIELYRQQIVSVKKQHAELSRELINRLEENDKLIQKKYFSFESSIGGSEGTSAQGLLDSHKRRLQHSTEGSDSLQSSNIAY